MNQKVKRKKVNILGDPGRVIAQQYLPGTPDRIARIIQRVMTLSEDAASSLLEQVMLDFAERHRDINDIFRCHFNLIKEHLPVDTPLSETRQQLIGAYFTKEYSIESAALFNPSIILHPNQDGVKSDELRFILSLRATGEGHISSIVFRSGILNKDNVVLFDPVSAYVETPSLHLDPDYDRHLFELKLNEMNVCNATTTWVFNRLPDVFSYNVLKETLAGFWKEHRSPSAHQSETLKLIDWLARSNYETTFRAEYPLCERVIFPVKESESSGIEDARFVRFTKDSGAVVYYATYTAYNGFSILPQLIRTRDFVTFNISTLNGKAIQNKGMALFPRKINGRYAMLSRQDGENNHIMFSDHLHFWQESNIIQEPTRPWEFIQIGNCGSPMETEFGWLVLTHGVGPMRQYCIGAMLLDLENPSRIIARLEDPLLTPHEEEREGYVPNVVYTCGALIHNNELVIPYAMSDIHSGIATVGVEDLINCMRPVKT